MARHGTLSGAARALGLTHATVARRLASLEEALGDRLVERRPMGYVLTAAGERALLHVSEMEAAADTLERGDVSGGLAGLVRINAPPSLAHGFLASRMAALAERHAGVDVELATDMRVVSLDRHETDIALRFGRPRDGAVLARPLVPVGFGFYATRAVRQRLKRGLPQPFVGFDEANATLPEAAWLTRHFPRARIALRCSSHMVQAEAAAAGIGIALLPHFVGKQDSRLLACALAPTPPTRELWLLTRRLGARDLAVRAVVEYLLMAFDSERGLFVGEH